MLRSALYGTLIVQFLCLVLYFQSSAAGKCDGPPVTGKCRAYFPSWFYNESSKACQRFIYGGCGGSDNRHTSQEACENACVQLQTTSAPLGRVDRAKPRTTTPSRPSSGRKNKPSDDNNVVPLETSSGGRAAVIIGSHVNLACKLNTTSPIDWVFYPRHSNNEINLFEGAKPMFKKFVKRFKSVVNESNGQSNLTIFKVQLNDTGRFECLERQTSMKGILFSLEVYPIASSEACSGEPVKGSCDAVNPRWFFNATAGECQRFIYGGCGGNDNKYASRPACEMTCLGRPASSLLAPGVNRSREQNRPRLSKSSKSAAVTDGDVEMNDQPSRGSRPECSGPAVTGPCRGSMQMWFYNEAESACQPFTYGGCRGSRNRHQTRQQCERRCMRSAR